MSISRVELQGQVTRAQDFTNIKQHEDFKGMTDQSNIQSQTQQRAEHRMHQVNQGEQTENRQKRFDAKEQGNSSYTGDGGQNRKHQDSKEDRKFLGKEHSGFDIRI